MLIFIFILFAVYYTEAKRWNVFENREESSKGFEDEQSKASKLIDSVMESWKSKLEDESIGQKSLNDGRKASYIFVNTL
jgi:hypothetical protein